MARPYGIDGTLDWLTQLEKEFKLLANKEFIQQEYKKATEQIKVMQRPWLPGSYGHIKRNQN